MYRRCVFGAMALWLVAPLAAPEAGAAPADYCKAYAIDFADQTQRDTPFWQQRYADAEKSCLAQFTFAAPEVKAKPQKVAKAKAKPKPAEAIEPAPTEESVSLAEVDLNNDPAQPTTSKKARLKVGSVAWLDYCEKKYASFNRETGTYRSYTGVERKCLVTSH